jgi:flagellar hook protein FlgE
MAFNTALSGLSAAQTDLDVTGNNIANASTVGFKESRTEFTDIYARTFSDLGSSSPGRGVRVSRVAQQFTQGTVDFTGNSMDLATNGIGYFILQNDEGVESYTRAGQFNVDRDGNVVTQNGKYLQVFEPLSDSSDAGDAVFSTGATQNLQLPLTSGQPQSTGQDYGIRMSLNLNAETNVIDTAGIVTDPSDPDWFANDADNFSHVTSSTIYDSLGVAYTTTYYFIRAGDPLDPGASAGDWEVYSYIKGPEDDDPTLITMDSNALSFLPDGSIDSTSTPSSMDLSGYVPTASGGEFGQLDAAGGTYSNAIPISFGSTTQYGQPFAVNEIVQDGFTAGQLSGVDIDQSGIVFARFTNGASKILGQVALADFRNPQGLRQLGDTEWAQTFAAGDVKRAQPGTSGLGLVQAGALENSNVDLAEQLVHLIIAQRNFQANAKTIETANQITQAMLNIR